MPGPSLSLQVYGPGFHRDLYIVICRVWAHHVLVVWQKNLLAAYL